MQVVGLHDSVGRTNESFFLAIGGEGGVQLSNVYYLLTFIYVNGL